ncbi:sulfatase [Haloferula chungangensis]|uniref:Sulfatase n=1 Tax=Haloferula chungangensis TaxID=1048331 RepID=A0ABW2L3Z2_9BACT
MKPLRSILTTLLIIAPALLQAKDAKPNIVFILADDLGWADTTLYGHTKLYETPNIERLAKRGMTFTRAYSDSPLCSPTRSAILTGLSPARTGLTTPNCHTPPIVLKATPGKKAAAGHKSIQPTPVSRLNTKYPTLSKTLKAAGYATGHFGKWHLGSKPYSALEHGFDVDIPHWPGPGPAGSFVAPWKFKDFDHDPDIPNEHIEDRMAKEAAAFMEANRDKPFFLNYWMFSVHAPFDAKKELIAKYRKRINPDEPQRSAIYAAMIESMDDAVGTLLDTIDRLGIADNTIIVFYSDNGGNMYNQVEGSTPTSNAPLRGGKANVYEGGVRVPCIVDWPGLVKPETRSDSLIQGADFYPTFVQALGLPVEPNQQFDGVSILPALEGKPLERETIFSYFPHSPPIPGWLPPSVTVWRGDWKLIRLFHQGEDGAHRWLLYNLREDIGEKNDLSQKEPERVKSMDLLIEAFLKDTNAVTPVPNPNFKPSAYHPEREGVAKLKPIAKGKPPADKKRPVKPKS